MIRVLSVTIYKEGVSEKLYYEAFRDKFFSSNLLLTLWREALEREYSEIFKMPVQAYIIRRTKPDKEIDMMQVLRNTAQVMGVNIDTVLNGGRKREYVDVKKTAVMILFDLDFNPMEIEKQLPFKNRLVYDYRVKVENRFQTEKGYEDKYKEIREEVLKLSKIASDEQ